MDEAVRGLRALGRLGRPRWPWPWLPMRIHWSTPATGTDPFWSRRRDFLDGDEPSPELIGVLERWSSAVGSRVRVHPRDRARRPGHGTVRRARHRALPYALGARGQARCRLGDAGGLDDLRRAIRDATEQGAGHLVSAWSCNLGEELAVFEGPVAALEVYREALELPSAAATSSLRATAANFCSATLSAGEWGAALADAAGLARLLEDAADAWDLQHFRATQALLLVLSGNVAEAASLAAWAEESSRVSPLLASRAACLIALAVVRQAQGERAEALRLLYESATRSTTACEAAATTLRACPTRCGWRSPPATRGSRNALWQTLIACAPGSRGSSTRPRPWWPNTAVTLESAATAFAAAADRWRSPGRALRAGPGAARPRSLPRRRSAGAQGLGPRSLRPATSWRRSAPSRRCARSGRCRGPRRLIALRPAGASVGPVAGRSERDLAEAPGSGSARRRGP